MNLTTAEKLARIATQDRELGPSTYLIFTPPDEETLLERGEIVGLLHRLVGKRIPTGLRTVEKSHWVKLQAIELMGYERPTGLRTRQARQHKPKFIHQLLDIFVQSTSNLQVWNYVPYADLLIPERWNEEGPKYKFRDCRYLIVFHDRSGYIHKLYLANGDELGKWDRTGVKTIKWQANALRSYRDQIRGAVSVVGPDTPFVSNQLSTLDIEQKRNEISKGDKEQVIPLIKAPPQGRLLYSLEEVAELLGGFVGKEFEYPGVGQERVVGQTLEKAISRAFGYQYVEQTDTGGYPDLTHQLTEVKFQYSGTIDLGRHLPTSDEVIDEAWNELGFSANDVRYIVLLVEENEAGRLVVDSIVVTVGARFNEVFSICRGTNFKVQISIPQTVFPFTV